MLLMHGGSDGRRADSTNNYPSQISATPGNDSMVACQLVIRNDPGRVALDKYNK